MRLNKFDKNGGMMMKGGNLICDKKKMLNQVDIDSKHLDMVNS